MALNHIATLGWSDGGGNSLGQSVPLAGAESAQGSGTFAAGGNATFSMSFIAADLELVFIQSDQPGIIKTNSLLSPTDTVTITEGKPLLWYLGCGLTSPFAGNCTICFFDSSGSDTGTVNIRTLTS